MIAGVAAADRSRPRFDATLLVAAVAVTLLTAAWLIHKHHPRSETGELLPKLRPPVVLMIIIGSFGLGFANLGARLVALENAALPGLHGQAVDLSGWVASDPVELPRGTSFMVRVAPHGERLNLRMYEGRMPELGDQIEFVARVRRLDVNDDFEARLHRKGVVARATAVGPLTVRAHSSNPVLRFANRVRTRMHSAATRSLARQEAAIVLGMTIGDDRLMSEEVREEFRSTSLAHLTAVSGTNVAIVLGALLVLMRLISISRRTQILAGLITLGFFAVVTRWEPSVLRATVMASLGLAVFVFGRRYEPLHGLAFALIVLLAFDPMMAWSIGFQLSFAATLGFLAIAPRLRPRLPGWFADPLSIAIAAQAAVTPLLALHFGRVSLVSVPANLVAFPLVAPITVVGLVGAAVGVVWEPLALPAFELAGIFARGLRAVAHFLASIPGSAPSLPNFGLGGVLVSYLVIAGLVLWLAGRRARFALTAAAVAGATLLWAGAGASAPPERLRLTFIDVGQGDAALVESPGGARILIDGGPDGGKVLSALRSRGIRRLDMIVFTHGHFDHVNGLADVAGSVEVRSAVEPGVPNALISRIPPSRRPETVTDNDSFVLGDLTAQVLGPSKELREAAADIAEVQGEGSSLNDASVVMRVSWRRGCALFTGDLEEAGQEALLLHHRERVECEVLKAPHHGSPRLLDEFVESVDPDLVVISVGENDYGHPSRKALSIFGRAGARVLRTDRAGDIVVEMDSGGKVKSS